MILVKEMKVNIDELKKQKQNQIKISNDIAKSICETAVLANIEIGKPSMIKYLNTMSEKINLMSASNAIIMQLDSIISMYGDD